MMKYHFLLIPLMFVLVGCMPKQTQLVFEESGQSSPETTPDGDTTPPPDPSAYSYDLQVADRSYVESVLAQVFGTTPETTEGKYLATNIYQRIEFGGPCDPYAISDLSPSTIEFSREQCTNGISFVQASTNNAMRYSITMKACEEMVKSATTLGNVRKKIFPDNKWKKPSADSIKTAYKLFFPVGEPDTLVVDGFQEIAKASKTDEEAWKSIILTMCISPEWQSL